jgi:hypothetical protein
MLVHKRSTRRLIEKKRNLVLRECVCWILLRDINMVIRKKEVNVFFGQKSERDLESYLAAK